MKEQDTNRSSTIRLNKLGYFVALVQVWYSKGHFYRDLAKNIDLLGFKDKHILAIQATTFSGVKRAKDKAKDKDNEPNLITIMRSGVEFEIWAWPAPDVAPQVPRIYKASLVDGHIHFDNPLVADVPERKKWGKPRVFSKPTPGGKESYRLVVPPGMSTTGERVRERFGTFEKVCAEAKKLIKPEFYKLLDREYQIPDVGFPD